MPLDSSGKWLSAQAVKDQPTGFAAGKVLEAFLPLRYLPPEFGQARVGYEATYAIAGGDNTARITYGLMDRGATPLSVDGRRDKLWTNSDLISPDRIYDNVDPEDLNIRNVYAKRTEKTTVLGLDFASPLNERALKLGIAADTDGDGKHNLYASASLLQGYVSAYRPENSAALGDFVFLPGAKVGVSDSFLELALPTAWLPDDCDVTINLSHQKNGVEERDYVMAKFYTGVALKLRGRLAQLRPTEVRVSGSASNTVDIVILPDGYAAADMELFVATAKSMMEAFLGTQPFRHFKEWFNFYYLPVPSANGAFGTPFRAVIDENGRYQCRGRAEVFYALQNCVDYNVIWLVANHEQHGYGKAFQLLGLAPMSVSGSKVVTSLCSLSMIELQ